MFDLVILKEALDGLRQIAGGDAPRESVVAAETKLLRAIVAQLGGRWLPHQACHGERLIDYTLWAVRDAVHAGLRDGPPDQCQR